MSVAEPPIEVPTRVARPAGLTFACGFVALAVAAAALAGALPVEFSLATVFLFAGPHNWFEAATRWAGSRRARGSSGVSSPSPRWASPG